MLLLSLLLVLLLLVVVVVLVLILLSLSVSLSLLVSLLSLSLSLLLLVVVVVVVVVITPPEKKTHGEDWLSEDQVRGWGSSLCPPDCMAKAGSKGVGEGGTPTCGHIVRAKYYTPDLTNMNIQ